MEASNAIDLATIFIREAYHKIAPNIMPEPTYFVGRALNLTEESEILDEHTTTDGHRIISTNETLDTGEGSGYRVIDILGAGAYSNVFQCQDLSDPTSFVAIKILKNHPQYRAAGISEYELYEKLFNTPVQHPGKAHIFHPISSFSIDQHFCIIMPILQRSLFEGIGQDDPPLVLLSQIRMISEQVLLALDYTHSQGIVHCDVKPDNILYSTEANDDVVLIDYGSATDSKMTVGQYIQSRFYRSPEVMLGLPLDEKIDIWSVGCIAAELYLDFAIFACDSEIDAIHSMVAMLGPIDQTIIAESRGWWKFYDMSPQGYTLKMDPTDVLLERHLYHQIFEEIGAMPLDQMIITHFPLETDEEYEMMTKFIDFVKCLLAFSSAERLNAKQALAHPFIAGGPLLGWAPPRAEKPVISAPAPAEPSIAPQKSDIGADIFSLF